MIDWGLNSETELLLMDIKLHNSVYTQIDVQKNWTDLSNFGWLKNNHWWELLSTWIESWVSQRTVYIV